MTARIMVVTPRAVSADDRAALSAAGVVVVEVARPSAVRLLAPEFCDLPASDLLACAGRAIAASNTAQGVFGNAIAQVLFGRTAKEPAN